MQKEYFKRTRLRKGKGRRDSSVKSQQEESRESRFERSENEFKQVETEEKVQDDNSIMEEKPEEQDTPSLRVSKKIMAPPLIPKKQIDFYVQPLLDPPQKQPENDLKVSMFEGNSHIVQPNQIKQHKVEENKEER